MRTTLIGFCAFCLMYIIGCATVDITKTGKGYNPPTNPNDVEILSTRPEKRYVELGSISADGFAISDTAKLHNALRAKAAPLGADAVLITDSRIIPSQGLFRSKEQWCKGVAIKYENKEK